VNNAGGPPPGDFLNFTDEDWNNAFNLSFMSTMRMTREAVPHMRKVGAGRVINITSYSVKEPIAGLVLSNAIRSGVIGMAKTLSRELGKDNILINNICPGRIDTERAQKLNKARADRLKRPVEEINQEMADCFLRIGSSQLYYRNHHSDRRRSSKGDSINGSLRDSVGSSRSKGQSNHIRQ
jgi:3-oxoacyl-[acyl-carrier protein] reductase